MKYSFHYCWHFKLADCFPVRKAMDSFRDQNGRYFYEPEYQENDWQEVSLPHTFNDADLFRDRIEDAGSGQKRTVSFYRKWFTLKPEEKGKKVLIEFEGIRQTCYLYINGHMAGYLESGVAPFGFDLTNWINYENPNLIAVVTDNTSTRNLDVCTAETPNAPDVEPGSYLFPITEAADVPADRVGVNYFWNCNDFNPSIGGLSKNVWLHVVNRLYLTLPLYSNLRTKGLYVYGSRYYIPEKSAQIHAVAEVRNETGTDKSVRLDIRIRDAEGTAAAAFSSETVCVPSVTLPAPELSIIPKDAYRKEGTHYVPVDDEDAVKETETDSLMVSVVKACAGAADLRFWAIDDPYLYSVEADLVCDEEVVDSQTIITGFRKVTYDCSKGLMINDMPVWLTGYAQRSANEWAAVGAAVDWLKDYDAKLIRESNANHIRWMHVAACPADIRACDRRGIVCTQPAGDKERENFGRQWDQRVELMRDVIVYFRNNPSIVFWEVGNNAVNKKHMREMRLLKGVLDPNGGRMIGCRTINTKEVVEEAEYTGTMLNRHAGSFQAKLMPITETEYLREEAPRRVWDDFTPPDYDYDNLWLGKAGKKQPGGDYHDLTSEDLVLRAASGYSEFFNDRIGGASGKDLYSATAALCWTDSAQHGRQAFSENARMSGRVDAVRVKKQVFDVFRVMQSDEPQLKIVGHWNYPQEDGISYRYAEKEFDGHYWVKNGKYAYRNPKDKTVYVIGSYSIKKMELFINGVLAGSCDKPNSTFVFAFPHIDITQSGRIEAVGYGYDGKEAVRDLIETVGEPAQLKLTLHTGRNGLMADGADVAYADVEVLDEEGRLCPLCYDRIDFDLDGPAQFLGGYNSGKFAGYGRDNSVIHKNHVYAECGNNRVFIRSAMSAGKICLKAVMKPSEVSDGTMHAAKELRAEVSLESVPVKLSALKESAAVLEQLPRLEYAAQKPEGKPAFLPIPEADKQKYVPELHEYCKILINGDEPDTHSIRSVYEDYGVWGPVLYILERLVQRDPDRLSYTYDPDVKRLVVKSGGHEILAETGRTHLLVDGEENLMNGEPRIQEGTFYMEISALIPWIKGLTAAYDDGIRAYRIKTDN